MKLDNIGEQAKKNIKENMSWLICQADNENILSENQNIFGDISKEGDDWKLEIKPNYLGGVKNILKDKEVKVNDIDIAFTDNLLSLDALIITPDQADTLLYPNQIVSPYIDIN